MKFEVNNYINVLLALILMVSTSALQALPKEMEADRYLLLAKKSIEEKNYQAAVDYFEKIKALETSIPTVFWFHYGKALTLTMKSEEAILALNKYLEDAGKKGKFYLEALKLYSQAEQDITERPSNAVRSFINAFNALSLSANADNNRFRESTEYSASQINSSDMCRFELTRHIKRKHLNGGTMNYPESIEKYRLDVRNIEWGWNFLEIPNGHVEKYYTKGNGGALYSNAFVNLDGSKIQINERRLTTKGVVALMSETGTAWENNSYSVDSYWFTSTKQKMITVEKAILEILKVCDNYPTDLPKVLFPD